MGNLKSRSQEGFLLGLYANVFGDLATMFPNHRSTLCRDLETLRSRVAAEGVSFLTKTLPSLGKAFDEALDTGSFKPHHAFKCAKGRANPAFLRGLFNDLFDGSGNLVRHDPAVIRCIRQVCYLVYKMQFPYSKKDERQVIDRFLLNEKALHELELPDLTRFREIVARVLEGFNPREILPRHGPGSVATGERLDKKWVFSRLYQDIHYVYPYDEYFVVGGDTEIQDRREWYDGLTRCETGVAKVVLVPKDSRGPRLISMEPLEYQWIQQGLKDALYSHIGKHPLTRGRINFLDQSVNGSLALDSSRNRAYCTIDLKDASDLVSTKLVEGLLPKHLLPYFMAVRSHVTTLPDGEEIVLKKYAPMGSAVCFPVEAIVFWTVAVVAVADHFGWRYSDVADLVYTYGDDLIVPTVCFDKVVQYLESVGLVVNTQKCCRNGMFRESCGVDAYNGFNVTPLKMSAVWSTDPRSGSCLASYSAYANSLAERGYYAAADYVRTRLEETFGLLPFGTHSAGYPCIVVDTFSEAIRRNYARGFRVRRSARYQTYQVKTQGLTPVSLQTTLDGWPRLLRHVCGLAGREPDRVVLPRSTLMRWKWYTIR